MKRLLYLVLYVTSSARHWLRRRFTSAGLFVLSAVLIAAVVGVDTNETMAFQAFTFLSALVLVALAGSLQFRARFAVRHNVPRHVTVGEPFSARIELRNDGPRAQRGLQVLETALDPRPSYAALRAVRGGLPAAYRFWHATIRRNVNAKSRTAALPTVRPGERVEVRLESLPLHRGHLRFSGVTLARPDPLGLFRACLDLPEPCAIVVLPRRYPVPPIPLPGTRHYQPGGVALASDVGETDEFVGLRDYRPGDALQRIHWKSFARAGKPVVKEYQDEFFERHALVLDTFPLSGEAVFETAVSVAASFACTVDTQERLLDLMFVAGEAYCLTAGRGQLGADRLLEVLADIEPGDAAGFERLQASVTSRVAMLSACLCVLQGWDATRQDFVERLRKQGLPLLALVVCARDEKLPEVPWVRRIGVASVAQDLAAL